MRKGWLALGALLLVLSAGSAQAVIEDFNYPIHINTTTPGEWEWWASGDAPANQQVVASWSLAVDGALGSAGIGQTGGESYVFGTGSGDNPGLGEAVAYMDVGTQDWGIDSGVIADFLGPAGKNLHGGYMDVRALLSGFSGQIELGFVSDRMVDYGEGPQYDGFGSLTFDVTNQFAWYAGGDLDDYVSFYDDTPYGDLSGVKVLGVWVTVISDTTEPTISGELRVDKIVLTPEPTALLALCLACGVAILRRSPK